MQFFQLREHRYIIQLRKKYSWETFRKVAKVVPGTYSEVFAKKIYSSVFDNSIDLCQEYYKYYKDEYDNINQFMFWRYGVSEEIQNQMSNAAGIFLAEFEMDWQLEDNEILKEAFVAIFEELDK